VASLEDSAHVLPVVSKRATEDFPTCGSPTSKRRTVVPSALAIPSECAALPTRLVHSSGWNPRKSMPSNLTGPMSIHMPPSNSG
jgi:hypothetical protein